MTPLRLTIASLAAVAALAAAPAYAQYGRYRDWVEPVGVCQYEAGSRGHGPTFEYVLIPRCYPEPVSYERPWRRAHVLHSRG